MVLGGSTGACCLVWFVSLAWFGLVCFLLCGLVCLIGLNLLIWFCLFVCLCMCAGFATGGVGSRWLASADDPQAFRMKKGAAHSTQPACAQRGAQTLSGFPGPGRHQVLHCYFVKRAPHSNSGRMAAHCSK